MLALKAENISKQYRLGEVGTGTLSHDFNRFWHRIRGKEDPYLKIGDTNDRSSKGDSEYVWSLREIDFEIEQGDTVGIIGRNGAGKSTLLKLLSKVTKPTTGKIYTNGRIASLLEVGTGFNPEMTGRENIYLNGAILGMTRRETTRKFDEIVAFSGVERYIDTPVKRYSSGMYVRLAFAVAAHLESEILIVDEVLAVGDAEFQKKCLGKMGDVSKGEGRTVLFVSHNMGAVKDLCKSGIFLDSGKILLNGDVNKCIDLYSSQDNFSDKKISDAIKSKSQININSITINGSENIEINLPDKEHNLHICIKGVVNKPINFDIEALFFNNYDIPLAIYSPSVYSGKTPRYNGGSFVLEQTIRLPNNLNDGSIFMQLILSDPNKEGFMDLDSKIKINIGGYKMETGKVLNINNRGLLFLK